MVKFETNESTSAYYFFKHSVVHFGSLLTYVLFKYRT